MYSETKEGRVNDALDSLDKKFEYQDEIEKLQKDLRNAQDELKKVVEEKQLTLALKAKAEQGLIDARAELEQKRIDDATTSNMHKVMRLQAEKARDKYKDEKKKLEYMIADLLKDKALSAEKTRAKIRKIQEICAEE